MTMLLAVALVLLFVGAALAIVHLEFTKDVYS